MRGMYGAHEAISAPLTKKTAVTARRAVAQLARRGHRSLTVDGAHTASVATVAPGGATVAKWHSPRVPLGRPGAGMPEREARSSARPPNGARGWRRTRRRRRRSGSASTSAARHEDGHHLAGGGRRGALLRLDRREAAVDRRGAGAGSASPPRTARSIWSNVNVARVEELSAAGTDAAGRASQAFARRRAERSGVLLARAGRRAGARRRAGGAVPGAAGGVGVLRGAGAVLPQGGAVVGRQREAGRDAGAAPRRAHRRLGGGPPAAAPHESAPKAAETEVFRS